MVRAEYRGNRLAVELLESMKEWAKANGWKAIVGNGCIFSGRACSLTVLSSRGPDSEKRTPYVDERRRSGC